MTSSFSANSARAFLACGARAFEARGVGDDRAFAFVDVEGQGERFDRGGGTERDQPPGRADAGRAVVAGRPFAHDRATAAAVGPAGDVVQGCRRVFLVGVETGGRVFAFTAARQGVHGGDQRRREAGAADLEPAGPAAFRDHRGVVDGSAGRRGGVGGDVGDAAFGPAPRQRPVAVRELPRLRGLEGAAAASAPRPDRLAAVAVPRAERERGAADRRHIGRGRRIFGGVAAVSGRGGDRDALVVIRSIDGLRRGLAAAVAVGDLVGAERGSCVDGGFQVGEGVRRGLDEEDLAVLADRVGDLDVERDLERPAAVLARIGAFDAFLVDLAEAAVRGRAFRQPERFAVEGEVGFDRRRVVGVDDRNRLRGRRFGGQLVGAVELGRAVAGRAGGPERRPAAIGDHAGEAGRGACRDRARAHGAARRRGRLSSGRGGRGRRRQKRRQQQDRREPQQRGADFLRAQPHRTLDQSKRARLSERVSVASALDCPRASRGGTG